MTIMISKTYSKVKFQDMTLFCRPNGVSITSNNFHTAYPCAMDTFHAMRDVCRKEPHTHGVHAMRPNSVNKWWLKLAAASEYKVVIDRRLRPLCCHLGSCFKRPKSRPVRPLACNWYYCAQLIAKPKAACALRFSWTATSSNLGLRANP